MSDILSEAASVVNGKRPQEYGSPEQNFARIADLWTAYLNGRGLIDLEVTDGITAVDVAYLNILQKIARLEHGYHHDSVVDLAGYAACAAQINEPEPTFTLARCPLSAWPEGRCSLDALHAGDCEPFGPVVKCASEEPSGIWICDGIVGHPGKHTANSAYTTPTVTWLNNG